jgi:N-acetylglucosaminyldiphosphoundecaprenol N-acetyl-beta-D-mannosaminyltransferase
LIDLGKSNLLGVLVNAIDYDAVVDHVVTAARDRRSLAVTALAVHGVMCGALDPVHRYRLNKLDLVIPDGQPVRWGLNLMHNARLEDRVYGPTLMLRLCERAAREHIPIFLYGNRPPILERLQSRLQQRFPALGIAGALASQFTRVSAAEQSQIRQTIMQSGAKMTFVGLGCPRQEVWLYENKPSLAMPLIAVGAAFDFHAGAVPQAPESMQRLGLEWLFRLCHEPKRLWRRYLILNPSYLILLGMQAARIRTISPVDCPSPGEPMNFA